MTELAKITKDLNSLANKPQAFQLQRFFKTGKGQYGEGDIFLGLKVPETRKIAKKYVDLELKDVSVLLKNKIHEFRLAALLILVAKYQGTNDQKQKTKIVDFYLKHTAHINNWDLVDLSVGKILGDYLLLNEGKTKILDKLAKSKNLWERRMAMIATFAFIYKGRADEALFIAKKLLHDEHDLMHKAVGWMLREVGKRVDKKKLISFLDEHSKDMPRIALRYAIEHFSPKEREHYLKK
ncbi:MAG: DNA alkylation repair protein [Candidatus Falkowbacteria bacterium]